MSNKEEQEPVTIELGPTEAKHVLYLPKDCTQLLDFIEDGTTIINNMAAKATMGIRVESRSSLLGMIVLKAVEQLRFAVVGLYFGYYSGVACLLRVALDTIAMLNTLSRSPYWFKVWAIVSYLETDKTQTITGIDNRDLKRYRNKLTQKARKEYNESLGNLDDPEPVSDLIRDFNHHVHTDTLGVLERTGIDLELKDLLGESVFNALETAQGDFKYAIRLLDLKEKYSHKRNKYKVADIKYRESKHYGV